MSVTVRRRRRGGATFRCPKCGERTEVLRTRRLSPGSLVITRERACVRKRKCGERFTTEERETDE